MLETLITSKTRIKLLLKFFLNPETAAHLRGLSNEMGESSNAVRLELNRLEKTNMLISKREGNKKLFSVNRRHPLYDDINKIVQKYFGLDVIINNVVRKLGELDRVYLTGEIAQGRDSNIVDLVMVGKIDRNYLIRLIDKCENLIHRKIRFLQYSREEFEEINPSERNDWLLIWRSE